MYYMDSHPQRHLRGMIVGALDVPTEDVLLCLEDHVSAVNVEGDFETEYCDGSSILSRQTVNAIFDRTEVEVGSSVNLSGLPDPCMLLVDTEKVEVTGGSYTLVPPAPGEYLIEIFESKYERKEWIVTAS